MKYILAAIFLIGTTLSFPLGDSDESKPVPAVGVPVVPQDGEVVHKHEHDESHKDVSHEHHKESHHDSSEASEESSESNEKAEEQSSPQPIQEEIKPSEEKILDEPKKIELEPEKSIDILEAANKPAAIAESAAPEEQFVKNIDEKKAEEKPQSDPVHEHKPVEEHHENSVAAEVDIPKEKIDEPVPEGKSDLLDIPIDMKKDELKIEKPMEEMKEEMKQPIAEVVEKIEAPAESNEAKKLPEPESNKPEEISQNPQSN